MSFGGNQDTLLLEAIEAIYAAAPDPLGWPRALGAIAECFGDVGAILIWYRDNGTFGTVVSESLAAAQKDYEENGWASRDIKAKRRSRFFAFSEPGLAGVIETQDVRCRAP
jgi:hypothetical protein